MLSASLHNFPNHPGHPRGLEALVTDLVVGEVEYCNGLVYAKGISQGLEGWKNQPTNRVFGIPNRCCVFQLHVWTHLGSDRHIKSQTWFVSLQFLHGVQFWLKNEILSITIITGKPNRLTFYPQCPRWCWHDFPVWPPVRLQTFITDLVVAQVEFCKRLIDAHSISQGLEGVQMLQTLMFPHVSQQTVLLDVKQPQPARKTHNAIDVKVSWRCAPWIITSKHHENTEMKLFVHTDLLMQMNPEKSRSKVSTCFSRNWAIS